MSDTSNMAERWETFSNGIKNTYGLSAPWVEVEAGGAGQGARDTVGGGHAVRSVGTGFTSDWAGMQKSGAESARDLAGRLGEASSADVQ